MPSLGVIRRTGKRIARAARWLELVTQVWRRTSVLWADWVEELKSTSSLSRTIRSRAAASSSSAWNGQSLGLTQPRASGIRLPGAQSAGACLSLYPLTRTASCRSWKSVAPHLPFLHRIKPGHAVLSAPASKPVQYRLAAAYLTPSANRARSAKLRSSPDNVDPRTLAAVHALDSIEGHHRAAIKLANDPLFRRSDGTLLCWLALQPLLSPGGNGKGNSSFSISFTRRDVAEGVIAPAASLASAADFERVFAGCTDVGDQFARYLDTHTRINALLAEVTKAAYIATLPCDA